MNAEELLGKNCWELFPEHLGTAFDRELHRAVREQRMVEFETYSVPTSAWVEVRAYPSRDGLSVYSRDVTARRRGRDALAYHEMEQPRGALHGAGATTELVSIHDGTIKARQMDLDEAATFEAEKLVADVSVNDYDALLLPGGTVNPDQLRMNSDAVRFVKALVDSGKPLAAICHGPWTLVEADVVRGRRMTSWPSVRTDLRNAGADVVDDEVIIDGQFTTSRSPADLPAFCPAIVQQSARAAAPALA